MFKKSSVTSLSLSGVKAQLKDTGFYFVASVFDVLCQVFDLFSFDVVVDILNSKIVRFVIRDDLVFSDFVLCSNQHFSRFSIRDFNALL